MAGPDARRPRDIIYTGAPTSRNGSFLGASLENLMMQKVRSDTARFWIGN
jgi:hypothetical protein